MGIIERAELRGSDWVHVFNRGVSRRPIFERFEHFRRFRAMLARITADAQVEVHAWSLLTNHFHLLLRATGPEISSFMMRVQSTYTRSFNHWAAREGPLMTSRFRARRVKPGAHLRTIVRYIDSNPLAAGLAKHPGDYEHGSAHAYEHRRRGPAWLTRDVLEAIACDQAGARHFSAETYRWAFAPLQPERFAEVKATLNPGQQRRRGDFMESLPRSVKAGFVAAATNADGSPSISMALPASQLLQSIERIREPNQAVDAHAPLRSNPWRDLAVGLLYSHARLPTPSIAKMLRCSVATACRALRRHREAMAHSPPYAAACVAAVEHARRTVSPCE